MHCSMKQKLKKKEIIVHFVGCLIIKKHFSCLNVQTYSADHPASHFMGTGVLTRGQSAQKVKLISHLHLVPTLRIYGTAYPNPHTPPWCGEGLYFLHSW